MILYKTEYLTLKSVKRENKPDWVYAARENAKDVVVILPVIKDTDGSESVLFLITRRPPLVAENVSEFSIELPAGLVGDEDKNETVMSAIKKELLEETGLIAESIKIVARKVSTSGGLTSETSTIATAYIRDKNPHITPSTDGGIITDRIYVKKDKIKEFLSDKEKEGFSVSAQALAALFYL